ncbi:MAG: hypothetical protein IH984_06170 [Planctomycetes bacterium]|nr:hypothetical protein [Planctomycetota bacterium]
MQLDLQAVPISSGGTMYALALEVLAPDNLVLSTKDLQLWGYVNMSCPLTMVPDSFAVPGGSGNWYCSHLGYSSTKDVVKRPGDEIVKIKMLLKGVPRYVFELNCLVHDAKIMQWPVPADPEGVEERPAIMLGADFMAKKPWLLYGGDEMPSLCSIDQLDDWRERLGLLTV